MELGSRVGGVRRKRHFDFPSFVKGPDGPSRAPRKRHFDLRVRFLGYVVRLRS